MVKESFQVSDSQHQIVGLDFKSGKVVGIEEDTILDQQIINDLKAQGAGLKAAAAGRKALRSTTPSAGQVSMTEGSRPSYTSPMTLCMCCRMPGSFCPFVPHIPRRPIYRPLGNSCPLGEM